MIRSNIQSGLQTYLRGLSRRRNNNVVTADDAHTYLDRKGVRSKQVRTRLAYINSVLRVPEFVNVGNRSSIRPAARYRSITEWVAL